MLIQAEREDSSFYPACNLFNCEYVEFGSLKISSSESLPLFLFNHFTLATKDQFIM